MTRAQMRSWLRFRLGDKHPTNPIFTDAQLNEILEQEAKELQSLVNITDPNPYTNTLYGDLTANIRTYSLPSNYRSPGVREVALLVSGVYTPIGKDDFNELNRGPSSQRSTDPVPASSSSSSINRFSIGGGLIKLKTAPSATLSLGIRMEYCAHVTFGDSDSTVVQLPLELHSCVWLMAAHKLGPSIGDNGDENEKMAEKIYTKWAEGFKTTIGVDGPQIVRVGGHNKDSWVRE